MRRVRQTTPVLFAVLALAGAGCTSDVPPSSRPSQSAPPTLVAAAPVSSLPVATFSIVAFDRRTGSLGIAVQSKFFAVGSVVPFAAAGVGAVATQSYANTSYGPRGLQMMRDGNSAQQTLDALLDSDAGRDQRQVGIVDAQGNVANFTGDACLAWAGARHGDNYTVQGNILAGPEVVDAMAEAYEAAEGGLATRLVAALAAGQEAGGDARGRQSAALVVVREGAGYGGNDRYIDLRVDDHPQPIVELQRLLDIFQGREADTVTQRLLGEAAQASGEARGELLRGALHGAEAATQLDPGNGWGWMTRAQVHLELGDLEAAAEAGRQALTIDPWIKTAILGGIAGSTRLIEALLENAAFRRLWESIEAG